MVTPFSSSHPAIAKKAPHLTERLLMRLTITFLISLGFRVRGKQKERKETLRNTIARYSSHGGTERLMKEATCLTPVLKTSTLMQTGTVGSYIILTSGSMTPNHREGKELILLTLKQKRPSSFSPIPSPTCGPSSTFRGNATSAKK